jgi:hypothetical protein
MQLAAGVEVEAAPTWAPESGGEAEGAWQSVDHALRTIAQRRAALDADEARWLREAEALQIWRPLGMVSVLDYMERVLGYGPRVAQERLRVARALGALPQLTASLAGGELPFSAVRELTRVATPATEASWARAATGKNLRQIEELVADHRPGDRPEDPPDPEARVRVVRFELRAETFALLRQTRAVLDEEHGSHLPDDQFVAALCCAVLDGAPATEPTGRAKYQIAVTVCERCDQGWQEAAGAKVAIDSPAVERARCDAQHIGSVDGVAPERAHQDVPPSVVRFVWRRDGGRCRVPGCRSARGLEIHHLVHRVDGGSHDPSNIVLVCSSCHLAHHRGALTINGTAARLEVKRRAEPSPVDQGDALGGALAAPGGAAGKGPVAQVSAHVGVLAAPGGAAGKSPMAQVSAHVGVLAAVPGGAEGKSPVAEASAHVGAPGNLETAIVRTQAKEALVGLGWRPSVAQAAVGAAFGTLGAEATLERLIFEALRRCRQPSS